MWLALEAVGLGMKMLCLSFVILIMVWQSGTVHCIELSLFLLLMIYDVTGNTVMASCWYLLILRLWARPI